MEEIKIYQTNNDEMFKKFFPYAKASSTSQMNRRNNEVDYDSAGNPRRGPKGRSITITPYNGRDGSNVDRFSSEFGSRPKTEMGTPASVVYKEINNLGANMHKGFGLPNPEKVTFGIDTTEMRFLPPDDSHNLTEVTNNERRDAVMANYTTYTQNPQQPIYNGNQFNAYARPMPEIPPRPPVTPVAPPPAPAPEPIIPPTQEELPWIPTEADIVKVHGYNKTNYEIIDIVSRQIATCAKAITTLDDPTRPVNANDLIKLMEFLDNNALRALLKETFQNILKDKRVLFTTTNTYIDGTAVLEPDTSDTNVTNPDTSEENETGESSDENSKSEGADESVSTETN